MAESTQAGAESTAQPTGAVEAAHDPATGASDLASYEAEMQSFIEQTGGENPVIPKAEEKAESANAEAESAEDTQETGESEEEPTETEDEESEVTDETADEFENQEEEHEEEVTLQERFRFKSDEDKAVAALAKAKGISLVKAAEIIAKANEPIESQAESEPAKSVADLKSELTALRADLKSATVDMDFDKMAELQEEIELKRDEIDEAKGAEAIRNHQHQSKQDVEYNSGFDASLGKAKTFYPDLADPATPLAKKVAELDSFMEEAGDPLFHSPDKPFILAKQAAAELRIPMRNPKAAAPAKTVVKGRPAAAQPASGNARTATPPPASANLDKELAAITTPHAYQAFLEKHGMVR